MFKQFARVLFCTLGGTAAGVFSLSSLARSEDLSQGPMGPSWQIVQRLAPHDVRGLPRDLFNSLSAELCGNFFYVGSEDGILCFRRNPKTGKLETTLAGNTGRAKSNGFVLRAAGGRMYTVRADGKGITWYDVDQATGALARAGNVECPPCLQMIAGPDEKDLYLKTVGSEEQKILWFKLDAAGKPVQAGEIGGKGIGATGHADYAGLLQMSPDGKNLYSISAEDHAIAVIARKPSGEIAYSGAVALDPVAPRDPNGYRYQWASVAIPPDGKWLYASLWNAKDAENRYGIFQRNAASGALTFRETFSGDKNPLANLRAWNLAIAADGKSGCLATWDGPLVTCNYDAQSGRLTAPAMLEATRDYGTARMACDRKNSLLYVCNNDEYAVNLDGVFVVAFGKSSAGGAPLSFPQPLPGSPTAAVTLAGDGAPAAASAAEAAATGLKLVQALPLDKVFPPESRGNGSIVAHQGDHLLLWLRNQLWCAKRDLPSGRVACLRQMTGDVTDLGVRVSDAFPTVERRGYGTRAAVIALVGTRMYLTTAAGSGLGWYDVDAAGGRFTEKGLVESLPCSRMAVSPDRKDLYLKTSPTARRKCVVAYHLTADGKPFRVGEAGGDGADYTGLGFDSLKITPDGKFLYTIGANAEIGRIKRNADGSIEYVGTTDLAQIVKPLPRKHYQWVSLGITADSRWLYAYCEDYGPVHENFLAIFRRNLDSGELTLQESVSQDKDPVAGRRWAHLWFLPGGEGYLFGGYRPPLLFRVDPQNGRFVDRRECPERQAWSPAHVDFDAEHGLFCGVTGGDAVASWFFVLRTEGPPGK